MKKIIFKFMELFVNCTFPFILMILSLILFFGLVYEDYIYGFQFNLIVILLELLPFICYLIITLVRNKYISVSYIKSLTNMISASLLLPLFIVIFFASLYTMDLDNTQRDIKKYKNYYNSYKYIQNTFPKKLSKDIKKVEFHYSPGFLQAGEEYSLYYIDSGLSLSQLDKLYKKRAEWIGKINDYDEKKGLLTDGVFYYSPIDKNKNKNDFIIYLIDGNCDNSGYCNHGKYLLVAFNEITNEILYRSSDW